MKNRLYANKTYEKALMGYRYGDISLSPETRPRLVEDVMEDAAAYRIKWLCIPSTTKEVYAKQPCGHASVYKDSDAPNSWIVSDGNTSRKKVDVYVTPSDERLRTGLTEASWRCDRYFLAADYTYGYLKGKTGDILRPRHWRRICDELKEFFVATAEYCDRVYGEREPWRALLPAGLPIHMDEISPQVLRPMLEIAARKVALKGYGEWL